MKTEAQRIAIAEACGWKYNGLNADLKMVAVACWAPAGTEYNPMRPVVLPDYLTDLNAMHEAEKVLTVEQTISYVMVLCDQLELPHAMRHHARTYWILLHATAAQRAEAFLRTIGEWTED